MIIDYNTHLIVCNTFNKAVIFRIHSFINLKSLKLRAKAWFLTISFQGQMVDALGDRGDEGRTRLR